MSKKSSRSKSVPKRKPVNPVLVKLADIFSVVVFALFPILVGCYFLAMALGGFLYNNQDRLGVPGFLRNLYGFDLSAGAQDLIAQGWPEDVVRAYKVFGGSQYELDSPVFAVAYDTQPQSIKVIMAEFPAIRGAWRGGSPDLTFALPGAAVQPGFETRAEDWKDSITGQALDVYPWVTYLVTFDESALHTYLDAEAALDVTFAKPVDNSRDWTRETITIRRPLRFYVLTPDELEQLQRQIPRPDNVRLPLMNPLNPVFWSLILIGSGAWIYRSLRPGRAKPAEN